MWVCMRRYRTTSYHKRAPRNPTLLFNPPLSPGDGKHHSDEGAPGAAHRAAAAALRVCDDQRELLPPL